MDMWTDMIWHTIFGLPLLYFINRRWRRAINSRFWTTVGAGCLSVFVGLAGAVLVNGPTRFEFLLHQILFLPGIIGVGLIIFAVRAKFISPYTF